MRELVWDEIWPIEATAAEICEPEFDGFWRPTRSAACGRHTRRRNSVARASASASSSSVS